MTDEQREQLALHLDAFGLTAAAHAVRSRYDELDTRDAGCGCTIAVLTPCEKHATREAVPA